MNGSEATGNACGKSGVAAERAESKIGAWLTSRKGVALQIVAFYLAAGAGWELFAHRAWPGHRAEVLVDFLYLLFFSVPLYLLIDHSLATVRRKEAALHESRERTARILESNPCGVILVDPRGRFEYANAEAAKILGSEPGDLVGANYFELGLEVTKLDGTEYPREDRPAWRALMRGEATCDAEMRVRRPDGTRVILSVNAVPTRDAAGTVAGVIVSFFDVTDRRSAQDLDMRKLSLAIAQSPIAIMITDTEGVVEYVNPSCTRMTGYAAEELLGTRAVSCGGSTLRKFSQEAFAADAADAADAGDEWREVSRGTRKNGEEYWESVSISPVRDADGGVTRYLWAREDITERRRAEEALRAKEEHFRQMFEQAEEPKVIFEPRSARILDANPAAVRLFGHSREELLEKGLALVAEPETARELETRISAVDDDHKLALDMVPHRRKTGERIIVSIRGNSIRLLRGGRFTFCTFRDITERIRIENEAKSQQAQLIHANRMASLGTIVSGVAHEINNPNNLVMFNAPMIGAAWRDAVGILDERRRENGDFSLGGLPFSEMRDVVPKLIAGVSDASQRIKAIVGDLKEFARRDVEGRRDRFDVNDAVRATVAIIGHEILKGCSNFRVETADSLPPVTGSAQQMEQVIVNLIMNALQALPDKKRAVRVSTAAGPDGRSVEIRVSDEGRGMSPEVLARLSEPFFTTRSESGGLGLGLSISFSIVKAHGGAVAFRSEVGRGTTAVVTLPAAEEAVREGMGQGSAASGGPR